DEALALRGGLREIGQPLLQGVLGLAVGGGDVGRRDLHGTVAALQHGADRQVLAERLVPAVVLLEEAPEVVHVAPGQAQEGRRQGVGADGGHRGEGRQQAAGRAGAGRRGGAGGGGRAGGRAPARRP